MHPLCFAIDVLSLCVYIKKATHSLWNNTYLLLALSWLVSIPAGSHCRVASPAVAAIRCVTREIYPFTSRCSASSCSAASSPRAHHSDVKRSPLLNATTGIALRINITLKFPYQNHFPCEISWNDICNNWVNPVRSKELRRENKLGWNTDYKYHSRDAFDGR